MAQQQTRGPVLDILKKLEAYRTALTQAIEALSGTGVIKTENKHSIAMKKRWAAAKREGRNRIGSGRKHARRQRLKEKRNAPAVVTESAA